MIKLNIRSIEKKCRFWTYFYSFYLNNNKFFQSSIKNLHVLDCKKFSMMKVINSFIKNFICLYTSKLCIQIFKGKMTILHLKSLY